MKLTPEELAITWLYTEEGVQRATQGAFAVLHPAGLVDESGALTGDGVATQEKLAARVRDALEHREAVKVLTLPFPKLQGGTLAKLEDLGVIRYEQEQWCATPFGLVVATARSFLG